MTDTTFAPQPPAKNAAPEPAPLTRAQKAAIVIGILGVEAAGPILEQMDEPTLRNFAAAMSKLRTVGPEVVNATILEFLTEIDRMDETVNGGMGQVREILQDYVAEATLGRILESVDLSSGQDVWKALSKIDEQALAEFLTKEHAQTAAVILSRLSVEQAAKILGRLDAERARQMVFGLTKAATLDQNVIDAIAQSVNEDFLANHRGGSEAFQPADRIGTIMNYTSGEIRHSVLSYLDETQPDLASAVKAKMFTFQDIHERIDRRDVAAIIRGLDQETLLRSLKGAEDNAPETLEFMLGSISSRVAEQLRESLSETEKVKVREAEEAQNGVLKVIREMEMAGDLKLISMEE